MQTLVTQRLPQDRGLSQEALAAALIGAALFLYYVSPNFFLAGVATCFLVAAAWWRLDMALLTVALTAPFYRFPKSLDLPFLTQTLDRAAALEVSLAEYALGVCVLAWAIRSVVSSPEKEAAAAVPGWRTHLTWLPPALLVLAAALSLPFTEHLRFALREFRVIVVEPAVYYFLLVQTLRTPRDVARFLYAFVALGVGVGVYSLYHYLFVGVVETADGVGRVLAVYHSPNALALFLGRVIPVALAFGAAALLLARSWPRALLFAAASVPLFVGFYITFSRGAWLGIIAALALILVLQVGRRALFGLAGLALLALLAIPFLPWERLFALTPLVQRLYVWEAALAVLRDHPLTGVGMDNFLYYYPEYMLPQAALEPDISHPHNLVLDFWLRLGILGLAALVWLQHQFWSAAWRVWRSARTIDEKVLALALMASMVDFLVHGLIDNSYFLIDLAYIFWATSALMTVLHIYRRSDDSPPAMAGAAR